jgi:hypothetical protein
MIDEVEDLPRLSSTLGGNPVFGFDDSSLHREEKVRRSIHIINVDLGNEKKSPSRKVLISQTRLWP